MTRPPNILIFCADQQRFDTIHAHGYAHASTPAIDSLVRTGTSFLRTYCQSPICTPSRASMMTSKYPSTICVNGNGNARFPSGHKVFTKLFAEAGYLCGNIGKLHLASPFNGPEPRTDDGYHIFEYSHAPRENTGFDYADWVRAKGHSLDALRASPEGIPVELHQTTWCAERAVAFVEARHDRPWLLTVNLFDPHPPFDPPRRYLEMFDPGQMPGPHVHDRDAEVQARLDGADFQTRHRAPGDPERGKDEPGAWSDQNPENTIPLAADIRLIQAGYLAMIRMLDDALARILAALEATGQRQDTLVVFTSDHGEMLGDHGLLLKGARFYEGLVRVPLIFSLPGVVAQNARRDQLVEMTDLAPTLLDLCGIAVPRDFMGQSLLGALVGNGKGDRREHVRAEYFDALDRPAATLATMFRDERYKLVVYHRNPEAGELYDLDADPWEFDNLWSRLDHANVRADLLFRSFNTTVSAMDLGPRRVAPY